MLKHVFMCRMKERTPAARERAARLIHGLRAIDAVLELEVGLDVGGTSVSHDLVATLTFADDAALERYHADARHRTVLGELRALCEAVAIVEHETAATASLREYLTFDDLSLLPGSNSGTPDDVCLDGPLTRKIVLRLPIVSAGMPAVTGAAMAIAMGELGGAGVVHRDQPIEQQCEMVNAVARHRPDRAIYPEATLADGERLVAAASCDPTDLERARRLERAGARVLFLDTPNALGRTVIDGVRRIRAEIAADLVIGSVVDGETARRYIDIGIDGIKVGLGAGATCSIRQTAGVGAPQATALARCYEAVAGSGVPLISDGGIRASGDVVKAFALGAGAVMIGSMLSGCEETPAEMIEEGGRAFKRLLGLRLAAFELAGPTGLPKVDAYLAHRTSPRVEGGEARVPVAGPCHLVLYTLRRSLRAGVHLAGAGSLRELPRSARFIRASQAGIGEAGVRG